MADVVGLVASAVQLIDVGGRIIFKLSRFCVELQKVPQKLKKAKGQLEQLVNLLQMVKSDLQAPDRGPASTLAGLQSPDQMKVASSLISDALHQAKELSEILHGLEPTNGTFLKRKWRNVVSFQKEEDIVERCDRLESLKTRYSCGMDIRA
jgi:hypothetical protein